MSGLLRRRFSWTVLCFVVALASSGVAPRTADAQNILSAPQVEAALEANDLILIDIRTPEEWAETGIAQGAWPVSMHNASFPQELSVLIDKFGADRIAMICATGGRTGYVASVLKANGFDDIHDVSEGMLGNPNGPGWIARGMPLITVQESQEDYAAALQQ